MILTTQTPLKSPPFLARAGVAQLTGARPHKPESHGLDFRSGSMPTLQVCSPVGALTRGNRLIDGCDALPRMLLSLSLSLLSPH